MVATAGANGSVSVWDSQSGNKILDLQNSSPVTAVAFGTASDWLAAAITNQVIIWNVSQQKQVATLNNTGQVNVLKFSHDGTWLAGGNTDGSIYLWNIQQADFSKPVFELEQNGQVLAMDFSPDNHWLVTGGSEKFAYIWDVTNGEEMARLPHIDEVSSVSFSSDGNLLATASKKVVEIWNFPAIPMTITEDLEAAACERLTANPSPTEWNTYFLGEPFQNICPNLPSSN